MTSHELARTLLAGPDLPVVLDIHCDYDAIVAVNRLVVEHGNYTEDRVTFDGPDPTHVFVRARADAEFQVTCI